MICTKCLRQQTGIILPEVEKRYRFNGKWHWRYVGFLCSDCREQMKGVWRYKR